MILLHSLLTSMVSPQYEEFISKMEVAINHIVIKDSSDFPDYKKGGAIFYDIVTAMRTYPSVHENVISMLPHAKYLVSREGDYLVFIEQINSSPEGSSPIRDDPQGHRTGHSGNP